MLTFSFCGIFSRCAVVLVEPGVSCRTVRATDREGDSSPPHPGRVSFICSANRARSPFAAALLRRHLEGTDVVVDSFGVLERPSAPALFSAVRAARAFGIDLRGHRSRSMEDGALR